MKRITPRTLAIIGTGAVLIGLAVIWSVLVYPPMVAVVQEEQEPAPKPVVVPKASNIVTDPVSGQASQITIPSLSINLPVIDGYYNYNTHEWTLTRTKAQFATPSSLPNNTSGTTFIYGHDTKIVFNRLHGIKTGNEAYVTTANGYRFVYVFKDSVITTPLAIQEMTAKSETPRLSLQTCYGPTSADRQIFHFSLDRVEKV